MASRTSSRAGAMLVFGLIAVAVFAAEPQAETGDIDKFHRVDDRVSTGAQPTIPQIAALARQGFRTIVNLREPGEFDAAAEEQTAKDAGIAYVNIPVKTADPKPEQADAVLKVLSDPAAYPVFLHCGSGNRVGAFWMIRRILVDGWTAEAAEKEAVAIGLKSPNLKDFAREYVSQHSPGKK
jgi:uncharacterized protein (TIGR01244 family)